MWGNFSFDYACSSARGRSGGLVTLWDPNVFVKNQFWCGDNYIIVEGKWMNSVENYYLINVYGPQHQPEKANLWAFLRSFIQNHVGNTILFGDLNEVRNELERFGSSFSTIDASIFNTFIHDAGLIDLPMGGRQFTWMNKAGSKLSKIDRFLISDGVSQTHPDDPYPKRKKENKYTFDNFIVAILWSEEVNEIMKGRCYVFEYGRVKSKFGGMVLYYCGIEENQPKGREDQASNK
ncbi:RNA-directed DNA polymerase, eukaryota [Artemisia annua]|uniref:RNA-directed DNA polymerase, eukaryota n=1 Tax=Artemisia annua TaxID=35608 RepID=A0A2U1PRR7_ARTAN|nr:RNA-directed DNA polymerase, eukaryota [Artemisia annua]